MCESSSSSLFICVYPENERYFFPAFYFFLFAFLIPFSDFRKKPHQTPPLSPLSLSKKSNSKVVEIRIEFL